MFVGDLWIQKVTDLQSSKRITSEKYLDGYFSSIFYDYHYYRYKIYQYLFISAIICQNGTWFTI